jgi:hypothetical protein
MKREKKRDAWKENFILIGNKWWKIMTIYSKAMKTTKKQGRSHTLGKGHQQENRRKRSKKLERGEGDGKRKSKDKVENAKGKRLVGGKEQRRKGVGDRNKTVDFYFFGIAVLCFKKMYPGI